MWWLVKMVSRSSRTLKNRTLKNRTLKNRTLRRI